MLSTEAGTRLPESMPGILFCEMPEASGELCLRHLLGETGRTKGRAKYLRDRSLRVFRLRGGRSSILSVPTVSGSESQCSGYNLTCRFG